MIQTMRHVAAMLLGTARAPWGRRGEVRRCWAVGSEGCGSRAGRACISVYHYIVFVSCIVIGDKPPRSGRRGVSDGHHSQ